MHDARREDLWVGEVLEHPFAFGLGVRGVDDHLETAGGEDGGGVGADVAGAKESAGVGGRGFNRRRQRAKGRWLEGKVDNAEKANLHGLQCDRL